MLPPRGLTGTTRPPYAARCSICMTAPPDEVARSPAPLTAMLRRVLSRARPGTLEPVTCRDPSGPMSSRTSGAGMGVRPHPHVGLATVTYLFEGGIFHRDSLGYAQAIRPGDVNWMTAGSGIAHSERTEPEMRQSGFRMHGVQTWVALPQAHEEAPPTFEHVAAARLPAWQDGGTSLRLIVGTYAGRMAPTTHFSPIFYVAAEMPAAAKLAVTPDHAERGIYIAAGTATIGDRQLGVGDLAVLAAGANVDLVAGTDGAKLMLLGGAALDGPRHIWWNFVSSSKERIERAKAHWKEGRFAKVPGDPEFIPLPER